ncbi:MAG: PfkB family carbohydrate kinase [Planctomycetota bacterium]|nr:PfkB family carbohydrate kinase [Planctomycetota bacterium]
MPESRDAIPFQSSARVKILSRAELLKRRAEARAAGKRVVQCHGCFDIVHPGHIRHLRQAKNHGEILLVSITGDRAWTKRQGAPLIPEELRAENLAELDCVDWVFIEPAPTALELLQAVQPDVYVKGREYETNNDPRFAAERRAVEEGGGRVVFSSGDVVFSSTALISALERSIDPYHARLMQLLARPELDQSSLGATIAAFRGKRILVVGEAIVDSYFLCDQPEVAAESPVMTLRPLERRRYDGGAAIIARHIAAMGGKPVLLTGLPERGDDGLRLRLAAEGVEVVGIEIDQPLAEKQRYLVGTQKVMKVNNLTPIVLDAQRQHRLTQEAVAIGRGFDGAIIADFGNGLLSPGLITRLGELLRPLVGVLTGDVSGSRAPLMAFHNFDLLSPSEAEVRGATLAYAESLPAVAWRMMGGTSTRRLLITLGGDGLIAFEPLPEADAELDADAHANLSRVRGEHVPALTGTPIDPLGCGDALISAATLALTTGASTLAAAFLGSVAAASEAQRLGNVPINAADLRHGMARIAQASLAYSPDTMAQHGLLAS